MRAERGVRFDRSSTIPAKFRSGAIIKSRRGHIYEQVEGKNKCGHLHLSFALAILLFSTPPVKKPGKKEEEVCICAARR
jgi:hypothetical protein